MKDFILAVITFAAIISISAFINEAFKPIEKASIVWLLIQAFSSIFWLTVFFGLFLEKNK